MTESSEDPLTESMRFNPTGTPAFGGKSHVRSDSEKTAGRIPGDGVDQWFADAAHVTVIEFVETLALHPAMAHSSRAMPSPRMLTKVWTTV